MKMKLFYLLIKIVISYDNLFDNTPINFIDSNQHLGVTFSITGQWHSCFEKNALSATKILVIMSKLKYSFSKKMLSTR